MLLSPNHSRNRGHEVKSQMAVRLSSSFVGFRLAWLSRKPPCQGILQIQAGLLWPNTSGNSLNVQRPAFRTLSSSGPPRRQKITAGRTWLPQAKLEQHAPRLDSDTKTRCDQSCLAGSHFQAKIHGAFGNLEPHPFVCKTDADRAPNT